MLDKRGLCDAEAFIYLTGDRLLYAGDSILLRNKRFVMREFYILGR